MYKCHLCELETKQLNGLLGRHWKKHCSDKYLKEQYKIDLLNSIGRKQPICPICDQPTLIPKGEKDYPLLHKKCYLKTLEGVNNPNWNGGKQKYVCKGCGATIDRHATTVLVDQPFCSTSCSMNFYAVSENRTSAQLANDESGKDILAIARSTDKWKLANANAIAKLQEERKSQVELDFLEAIRVTYADALGSQVLDFYTWDCYIPSTNELFEVNGNYWHNKPDARIRDIRKAKFLENNRPEYTLYFIWENEIKDLHSDKLLEHAKLPVDVFILGGPCGCGKSYLGEQLKDIFEIVDYDKLGFEGCINKCKEISNKPKLLITPIQVKRISKVLRNQGIRNWCVYLREDVEVVRDRLKIRSNLVTDIHLQHLDSRIKRYESLKDRIFQYYGTQDEVRDWLLSQV